MSRYRGSKKRRTRSGEADPPMAGGGGWHAVNSKGMKVNGLRVSNCGPVGISFQGVEDFDGENIIIEHSGRW